MLPRGRYLKAFFLRIWRSPTFMTWLSLTAKSGGLLLIAPLVLREFHPAQAAVWFLFLTFNNIMQQANFGLAPTFVRAISYARAGRRTLNQADDLLPGPNAALLGSIYCVLKSSYRKLSLLVAVIALLVGTAALFKPISGLANPEQGWIGWAIVACSSLVSFRNGCYAQWLQGLNQVALLRRVEAVCAIVAVLGTMATLWFTKSFIAGITAMGLGWVASSYVIRLLARSQGPTGTPIRQPADAQAIKDFVFPAAWRAGLGVLLGPVLLQSLGIIYAQFAPAEKVASYLFAVRCMGVVNQVSMAPFYSKLQLFAALYGNGETTRLSEIVRSAMAKTHWLFLLLAVLIGLVVPPLLLQLGSQITFVEPRVWFLLALGYFLHRFGAMHLQFYSLSNHVLMHIYGGLSGVLILITALCLLPLLGQIAMPLAIVLGYSAFYSWMAALTAYRHYNIEPLAFETKASLIPGAVLLAFAAGALLV